MCVHSLATILFTDPRHERKGTWRVRSTKCKNGSAQKSTDLITPMAKTDSPMQDIFTQSLAKELKQAIGFL